LRWELKKSACERFIILTHVCLKVNPLNDELQNTTGHEMTQTGSVFNLAEPPW